MKISCGILFYTEDGSILLGHATGMNHWDIFKGMQEDGETFEDTAIRETVEECGIVVDKKDLTYIGRFKYMKGKDLVIFSSLIEKINIDNLKCSTFVQIDGKDAFPEMDKFSYFSFEESFDIMSNSLKKLFLNNDIINLIKREG